MVYWIYELPNWLVFTLFTTVAVAIGWAFIFGLRRVNRRLFGDHGDDERNSLIELVLTGTGLFYGLLLGLIAAATYTTYAETESGVNAEATTITALYRDVSGYPQPIRQQLQTDVRNYVDFVINVAWPQQQQGEVPHGGVALSSAMQERLITFEPVTEGDKIMHAETLRQFTGSWKPARPG